MNVEIFKCDSTIWSIFTECLENLELKRALEVQGACEKGMDYLRWSWINYQRNGSSKRGFIPTWSGLGQLGVTWSNLGQFGATWSNMLRCKDVEPCEDVDPNEDVVPSEEVEPSEDVGPKWRS